MPAAVTQGIGVLSSISFDGTKLADAFKKGLGNPQIYITVQDNRSYLVPCKLHSRANLIAGMHALGYELHSEWPVHELRLLLPTHPDLSARTYSGFYFRRK